jgi:hypothetical protein
MTAPAVRLPRLAWTVVLVRALGVATAALLAIDAYVHFHDAGLYDIGTGASITEGSLFRAQASVAVVVALALLVRPHWLVGRSLVVALVRRTCPRRSGRGIDERRGRPAVSGNQ